MISRLGEAGLIRACGTSRDQQYPERTSYELTAAGRDAAQRWLGEMLSTPRPEFPEFPAALSFLMLLTPQAAAGLLAGRRERLAGLLAGHESALAADAAGIALPRVTMLESEYLKAVTEAELRWVDAVLADLADGSLSWDADELREIASQWRPT
jgi:hypothetical protein